MEKDTNIHCLLFAAIIFENDNKMLQYMYWHYTLNFNNLKVYKYYSSLVTMILWQVDLSSSIATTIAND